MWNQQVGVPHRHLTGPMGVSPLNTSYKSFASWSMNVLALYVVLSVFFVMWQKKYFRKLLYLTQNCYCSRFIYRSENLVHNGDDNSDNHNQPQFEHQ